MLLCFARATFAAVVLCEYKVALSGGCGRIAEFYRAETAMMLGAVAIEARLAWAFATRSAMTSAQAFEANLRTETCLAGCYIWVFGAMVAVMPFTAEDALTLLFRRFSAFFHQKHICCTARSFSRFVSFTTMLLTGVAAIVLAVFL